MVGYRVRNLDSIASWNKCTICSFLLRDPVQLVDCAHRFCQSCISSQIGDFIICPECQQTTSRNKIKSDRGCKNDMQNLSINCSLCDWTGLLKNYKNHLDQTHPNPICEYCNTKSQSGNDSDEHILFHCSQVLVDCPLKAFGCEEQICRIDLNNHYLTEQHQINLINFIVQFRTSLFPSKNNRLTDDNSDQLNIFNESVDTLFGTISALNDDQKRVYNEYIQYKHNLEKIQKDLSDHEKSFHEQDEYLEKLTKDQKPSKEELTLMQEQLSNIILPYSDGKIIWKIKDVQEKFEAARSEIETSYYSPSFYTSLTGYKMCLRLYPNGDGHARKTHMSLHFVLQRGEYDAILHFPFCFNVIFYLLDQTDKCEHIYTTLKPDILSNCLQRPRSGMNVPYGISKFVDLSILQQENNPYIRDNTMFIEAKVDFSNIS